MGNTLTIRFPQALIDQLRQKSDRIGLPVGQVVRQYVENGLAQEPRRTNQQAWRRFAGIIKGGPPDLSSRKGFSRK